MEVDTSLSAQRMIHLLDEERRSLAHFPAIVCDNSPAFMSQDQIDRTFGNLLHATEVVAEDKSNLRRGWKRLWMHYHRTPLTATVEIKSSPSREPNPRTDQCLQTLRRCVR